MRYISPALRFLACTVAQPFMGELPGTKYKWWCKRCFVEYIIDLPDGRLEQFRTRARSMGNRIVARLFWGACTQKRQVYKYVEGFCVVGLSMLSSANNPTFTLAIWPILRTDSQRLSSSATASRSLDWFCFVNQTKLI